MCAYVVLEDAPSVFTVEELRMHLRILVVSYHYFTSPASPAARSTFVTNSMSYFNLLLLLASLISSIDGDLNFHPIENRYISDETNDNHHQSKQYGNSLSRCEFYTLRLGSEITDIMNSLHNEYDTSERIFQDFIIENLGFAPWIAEGINNGKSLTGLLSHDLHKKGGWIDHKIDESTYEILNHKWVYMYGDSTTRQVWASYAAPFRENNFERNVKEWTRHYCNKQQPHRKKHIKDGHFDEEGWRGPCGVNEVTCHVSGYGENGLLTFDWKHFPYEDYDDYLFNENGPWRKGFPGEGIRRPDLLTIQMNMHSCWHAYNEGIYSQHLQQPNVTMIEQHKNDIWKLMAAVRTAVDTRVNNDPKMNATTVIVLTSGFTGYGFSTTKTDACIQQLNRVTTEAANSYGFAVLDRGEIERRMMYKSLYADNPVFPNEMHLIQPAQNLISTLLLQLYRCLHASGLSRSEFDQEKSKYPLEKKTAFRNWRYGNALHNPQK